MNALVITFLVGYAGMACGLAGAVLARRFERRKWEGYLKFGSTDPRFTRLEHSVDAIAVEVERISEGQRFVTKLLAEKTLRSRSPVPGISQHRSPTPV